MSQDRRQTVVLGPKNYRAPDLPMDEADVLQTAKLMIDEYGVAAESQAALRVDKAFLDDDIELEQTWKRIVAAIRSLRAAA